MAGDPQKEAMASEEEMDDVLQEGADGEYGDDDVLDEGDLDDELHDVDNPEHGDDDKAAAAGEDDNGEEDVDVVGDEVQVEEHGDVDDSKAEETGAAGSERSGDTAAEGAADMPAVPIKKVVSENPDNMEAVGVEFEKVIAEPSGDKQGVKPGVFDPLTRPPHGSEIYISGIQPDWVEEDLREFCSQCGEVFEVRLPKEEASGTNKRFAFVSFTSKEEADKALKELNNTELKGRRVRVSESQSKHRLFIGNLPKQMSKEELMTLLLEQGKGITVFDLLMDKEDSSRNRGYGFVEYFNHACAEAARRNLSRPGYTLAGRQLTVNWAEAKPDSSNEALQQQVKVVYVKGVPEGVTEEQLRSLFEKHGEIVKVVLPTPKPGQKYCNFAFVHYEDRKMALAAIEKTETYELDGAPLEVSLARPQVDRQAGGFGRGAPQYQTYGSQRAAYGSYGVAQPAYQSPARGGSGGLAMVPMTLPDGRIGYVLQQPLAAGAGGAARRGSGMLGAGPPAQTRRYRPY